MANRKVGMFGVEPNEFIDERNEDGVAALLRRRREELGRDIGTVARQLRIRAVYISAIEDGRLQDLPGTAYAVGFVRAYADYLGLDGNSVVGDYRDELARRSRQNQLVWPVDQIEHKHFPGGIILAACVVLAGAIYGGWYFASQPGGTGIDIIDQVPEFMKKQPSTNEGEAPAGGEDQSGVLVPTGPTNNTPASAQASQLTDLSIANTADSAETIPADQSENTAEVAVADPPSDEGDPAGAIPEPSPAQSSEPPISTPTPSLGEQVASAATLPVDKRVVLRASKDSWVEIFDAKEEIILQRILRAGETFAVPVQDGLVMNTANAGGVTIEIDGAAGPALGAIGVIKRGIKLDAESLGIQ